MEYPKIIQGGMGIAVSGWKLAKAVSAAGQLGVVSGTALDAVMALRLRAGDKLGDMRRALKNFPSKEIGKRIIEKFFLPENAEKTPVKIEKLSANLSAEKEEEIVAANFSEVFLAKEGHKGIVGLNLLEKIQIPNLASIYGALLAGVDYIIMGAGIPREIPAVIEKLVRHEPVSCRLNAEGTSSEDDFRFSFDPARFGLSFLKIKKPKFLAIISSNILAATLMKKSAVKPDGFIIEAPSAGGHNAPPRVQGIFSESGEPVYGEKDAVDLGKIKELGAPFWLAGSCCSKEALDDALSKGASGVQIGTAFACCRESGFTDDIKDAVLEKNVHVKTDPLASPTGFPFKVASLPGTLAEKEVYEKRKRVCNLGYLLQPYKKEDATLGYRCPSEPVASYEAKGGKQSDTEKRKCLCNGLMAAIGLPLTCADGSSEKPLVTLGDMAGNLAGAGSYGALDVINWVLNGVKQPAFSGA